MATFAADLGIVAAHGAAVGEPAITASPIEMPVDGSTPSSAFDLTEGFPQSRFRQRSQ